MLQIILDDTRIRDHLFPFAQINSVADIRVGILTLREKWEKMTGRQILLSGEGKVDNKIGQNFTPAVLSANIIPDKNLIDSISKGENYLEQQSLHVLQYPWNIFQFNDRALREDFALLTEGRTSEPLPSTVRVVEPSKIFIEKGARLHHCILNATEGPIYIGKDSQVMEGVLIRGPFALCEGATVKMGAKIYGATTIGPHCVVAGEIKNSVFFGYSNKAHDGYLGDAVIGEWCNLGAGTSNSNVKNNAGQVKVWHQSSGSYIEAGIKCGLLMGDYSRCAINTSFNTGTVVGIGANVFGEGLTPKLIPNFAWGCNQEKYQFDKAIRDIENWKKLKNKEFSSTEIQTLKTIFDRS